MPRDQSVSVRVEGLQDLRRSISWMGDEIPHKMRASLLKIAEKIAVDIRAKVPVSPTGNRKFPPGTARASVGAHSSETGAWITAGGTAAPYFPWLDFGGTVGRGHKGGKVFQAKKHPPKWGAQGRWVTQHRAWGGNVYREWMGRPVGDGRYIYPTIMEHREDISKSVDKIVTEAAKKSGFDVSGKLA